MASSTSEDFAEYKQWSKQFGTEWNDSSARRVVSRILWALHQTPMKRIWLVMNDPLPINWPVIRHPIAHRIVAPLFVSLPGSRLFEFAQTLRRVGHEEQMALRLFKNPHKVRIQMVMAACASFSFMCMGTVRGWSSPGIPSLLESGDVNVTDTDVSWISSLPPLASLFGSLIAGPCLQFLGRKTTLILIGPIYSVGFLVLGFATEAWMLYAGRIIDGLMIGFSTPSAQIFIGESASPRVRGALGSFPAIFLSMGILIAYVIGAFVKWNVLAWILAGFPIFLIVAMLFMPETPAWLMGRGREEDARKSLQFLRGRRTDISAEFERLKANVAKASASQERIKCRDLFRGPVLKPLLLSMGLMCLQQFSGINAIIYFTVSIFTASGSEIPSHVASIIVGAVQVVTTIVSMFLVDRAGRRVLLLVSGSVMSVALAALGTFFYLKNTAETPEEAQQIVDTLGWLPLVSLIVFIVAYSCGYANVPFLIMGELFPVKYRSILGSLASSFNLTCTFTIVMSFRYMRAPTALGEHGTFWFYMSFCVVGLFYVFFLLPETKGKTLEEIEQIFDPSKRTLVPVSPSDKPVIFTIEPIISKGEKHGQINGACEESSDDEEDQDQLVPTPL